MARAQIQTQIFVYILSMIVIGLVLLYGYNAIRGFRERQEQVSLIEVENQLKTTIKALSSDYDSIRKEELLLPSGFNMICFVDNRYLGYGNNVPNCVDLKQDSRAIVEDAMGAGTANIFLVPDGTENYMIGNIEVSQGCICIERTGNKAVFRVKGLGNGVEISEWS